MITFFIAVGSLVFYIIAYNTYGRWLSRKLFQLNSDAAVPAREINDGGDYVPTRKEILFGHHFTSIAGTGPIVGPALAVMWGWLPALLWVLFGSVLIGAVHDLGALVVSMRNRGQTIGDIAGRLINRRVRLLFLIILALILTMVLAIFGLVIATIFDLYPASVLSVWVEVPLAVFIGWLVYRKGKSPHLPAAVALLIMIAAIVAAVMAPSLQFTMPSFRMAGLEFSPIVIWTFVLLVYCYIASTLPVWRLLQPRDYINSHELVLCLALLVAGIGAATFFGGGVPIVAPAVQLHPEGAPPIMPFLFITIACGAVSGFHCLVSSGTSSKQIACETDAQFVGYGSMLTEGFLAVLVILACCAGIGMAHGGDLEALSGTAAWAHRYTSWKDAVGLAPAVGAFVDGGGNFVAALGIPREIAVAIIAVLVASFAATTLDTATRLQRYVIQELASTVNFRPLTSKHGATLLAVVSAAFIAALPPGNSTWQEGMGLGGKILWPLFGATNQLLAGLAFLVVLFYLKRRNKPVWFIAIPAFIMLVLPFIAMCMQVFGKGGWLATEQHHMVIFACFILFLEAWMIAEAISLWPRIRGVLEVELPPLTS